MSDEYADEASRESITLELTISPGSEGYKIGQVRNRVADLEHVDGVAEVSDGD